MSDWEDDVDASGMQSAGLPISFGSTKFSSDADDGLPKSFGSSKITDFGNGSDTSNLGFGFQNLKVDDIANNNNAFNSFESSSDGWQNSRGGQGGGRGRGRGRGGRGRGGGTTTCYKCQQEGHMARECPNGDGGGFDSFGDTGNSKPRRRECFKCHQEGHLANACPNEKGSEGGSFFSSFGEDGGFGEQSQRKKGCFKCGDEGHISRDCPESSGGRDGPKKCFKCGEGGHMSRDCTKEGGAVGEDGKPRQPLYIPVDLDDEQLISQGIEAGINFDNFGNIPVKVSGSGTIPNPVQSFEEMQVRKILLENLEKANFKCPTPIQKYGVPVLMGGRDIMACAQTGSGKTIAYLLPMLNHILQNSCDSHAFEDGAKPTSLIICPTRELALQIYYEARKLVVGSTVMCRVVYGGTAVYHQLKLLQSGCHLVVATVGRLMDFIQKGKILLDELKYLVLDEADRMMDMGFLNELRKLFEHTSLPPCDQRQTLMFSATFPSEIQTLAANFMKDYVFVVVGTVGAANTDVSQEIIEVERFKKKDVLIQYIRELRDVDENIKILIFVEQKKMTDFIGAYLCNNGMQATTIHGDRYQSQREEALSTFRSGQYNILVATAVAARGLDIKGVGCVLNFDLPKEIDEYVHRIGRTGRVGNRGHAISFYDAQADGALASSLLRILSDADQEVPVWLKSAGENNGLVVQGYQGSGSYASTDVRNVRRQGDGNNWQAHALGGPMPNAVVDDEDSWD